MGKLLSRLLLIWLAIMIVQSLPELRRYLEIRRM